MTRNTSSGDSSVVSVRGHDESAVTTCGPRAAGNQLRAAERPSAAVSGAAGAAGAEGRTNPPNRPSLSPQGQSDLVTEARAARVLRWRHCGDRHALGSRD
ncbi:Hypothetical protein SMAX5B_012450 [Scophthalmus maximus]|uniref:Uncharacterized protein n=1 Tax=Scophthalmus maximus TaxID=52904 RepID=A0A2U9BDB0_SCOMX|nr:Hypothetical protein SMAX5B_012450 [Scophthalmus maximus]